MKQDFINAIQLLSKTCNLDEIRTEVENIH
jgi:hypothetical protein